MSGKYFVVGRAVEAGLNKRSENVRAGDRMGAQGVSAGLRRGQTTLVALADRG